MLDVSTWNPLTTTGARLDWERLQKCRTAQEIVGEIGEGLTFSFIGGKRNDILDKWNSNQDQLDPYDRTVEIKTQFSISLSGEEHVTINRANPGEKFYTNFMKCLTVDRLIFVIFRSTGDSRYPVPENKLGEVRIVECVDRKKDVISFSTSRDLRKYAWPVKPMRVIAELEDRVLADMLRYYSDEIRKIHSR